MNRQLRFAAFDDWESDEDRRSAAAMTAHLVALAALLHLIGCNAGVAGFLDRGHQYDAVVAVIR